jgi:hypothetical protein
MKGGQSTTYMPFVNTFLTSTAQCGFISKTCQRMCDLRCDHASFSFTWTDQKFQSADQYLAIRRLDVVHIIERRLFPSGRTYMPFLGMEAWDQKYANMEVQGHVTFKKERYHELIPVLRVSRHRQAVRERYSGPFSGERRCKLCHRSGHKPQRRGLSPKGITPQIPRYIG